MSLFRHPVQTENGLAHRLSRTASNWQTPRPPPQQQPPLYGQQPPPHGQNPWDQPPSPGYGAPPPQYQYQQEGSGIQGRHIIGGLMALWGGIIILVFFVAPWVSYDSDDMEDAARDYVLDSDYAEENNIRGSNVQAEALGFNLYDGCKVTGFQVATRSEGNSDCPYDLVEANFDVSYEPDLQPIVEHSVFVMAALGICMVILGVVLMANMGSAGTILALGLLTAITLTIFPFGWTQAYNVVVEDISEHNTLAFSNLDRDDDRDTLDFVIGLDKAYISTSYQTIQLSIAPLLTLITVIAGFFVVGSGNKPPQYGQPMNPYQQQPPPSPPRY